jgi:sporulation protein YlmC with PRC-barrel domain
MMHATSGPAKLRLGRFDLAGVDPNEGESMRLDLGTPVRTTDAVFGDLADVVIDPIASRVTHLVVQPAHGDGVARLVPIGLVENDENGAKEIRLRCSAEDVTKLEHVQEFAFLRLGETPTRDADWDVGVEDVLALPYYEGSAVMGYGTDFGDSGVTYDRIPKGDVEIRRASTVAATDADFLGKVDGFVVDDEHITHFVLERGHLWGKREITIPIGAVANVKSDAITLNLSKSQVEDLPSVRVHRWS